MRWQNCGVSWSKMTTWPSRSSAERCDTTTVSQSSCRYPRHVSYTSSAPKDQVSRQKTQISSKSNLKSTTCHIQIRSWISWMIWKMLIKETGLKLMFHVCNLAATLDEADFKVFLILLKNIREILELSKRVVVGISCLKR